jgi:hypothetical protein
MRLARCVVAGICLNLILCRLVITPGLDRTETRLPISRRVLFSSVIASKIN